MPFADYFRIDNRLITVPSGTGRRLFINREPGSTVLTLWGNIPLDDKGVNEALAIEDPAQYAAALFRHLLEARGIIVFGGQRTRHTELAALSTFSVNAIVPSRGGEDPENHAQRLPQSFLLASYESRPLTDDVRVINKVSQNLHSEILLRLLGREKGTAGTVEGGLEVLKGFLASAGVPIDQYLFYDGSGLSRQNLVSPHAIVQLLRHASAQPWGNLYRDTLPVAGVDGSLAERLKDVKLQGTGARENRVARRCQGPLGIRNHRSRRADSVFNSHQQLHAPGSQRHRRDRQNRRGNPSGRRLKTPLSLPTDPSHFGNSSVDPHHCASPYLRQSKNRLAVLLRALQFLNCSHER